MGTIHGGPCSGSTRPKTLLSGSSRSYPRVSSSASPTRIPNWEREEGKVTSRAPGLVPSPRRLRRPSSPARIPNWEREEGKVTSRAPGLVPSLRRLLLASLTRSERRGKLHPERPASCRRSDPMMLLSQPAPDGEDCSICLASSSTTHSTTGPVLHGRKRCQCNPRCVVVSVVEYALCAMPTTACEYAIYLF